ncbi:MAG: hypothetical protein ACO1OC_07010 [Tuberibacillus sp.]
METHQQLEKLENEIKVLQRKIDDLERVVREKRKYSSSSVWVLVPVAAIVMWGLTTIFG